VRLKQDKPSWGAPKIRERLARLYPDVHTPAISTVHAVLDRHGGSFRVRGHLKRRLVRGVGARLDLDLTQLAQVGLTRQPRDRNGKRRVHKLRNAPSAMRNA
jgi:hypothetical protein